MRNFEYARPETEAEAVELLGEHDGNTAVLAGGTDLLNLMKAELVAPQRVVDIKHVDSLHSVTADDDGVQIGSLVTLDEMQSEPLLAGYQSLQDVIRGVRSIQIRQMGTIGGDLCHMPNCWYFRNGNGLLGLEDGKSVVAGGDNRYHAILGNRGPAKFVSASRFAPAMMAWGAKVRVIGPKPHHEQWIDLDSFYRTPKTDRQGVTLLKPGQLLTHIRLPSASRLLSASYEVLELEGLDWPLAAASAMLNVVDGVVRNARVVMGHVAPTPWESREAAAAIIGRPVTEATAESAGEAAIAAATPLSENRYKVRVARTAVKRAILAAAESARPENRREV
ncbi:FAD binding domain-containing protein [Thalassoroseus pseudoceratinae]|uniref:FAD binding domain-containing protein n=1 Tax=Thalassoroseus pseudoceratinae TaxID=2713176 RepID=UPI00141ECDEC|nr:FAD binding domain-containing protein [Thalassoroseus pseudoceratinae]